MEFISSIFSSAGFMPHGHCYLWAPGLVGTMAVTDTLIGLAYVSISLSLYFLVRRIKIPFHTVFIAFGLFIFACGATHFMEVYTIWTPAYWLAGFIKIVTAIASVATALSLFPLKSKIVAFAEAAHISDERGLQLKEAYAQLEIKVEERTAALKLANDELLKNEEKFKQLANSMPQIVWMARPDGYVDYYNDRWYAYTNFDAVPGGDKSWEPVIHPDDLASGIEAWYSSVKSGQPYEKELRLKEAKTGLYRWFLCRGMPMKDGEGKILRWFGTDTDIDEQKKLQNELQDAVSARDEFLSVASHELRTPLTSLKMQAQIIKRLSQKNDPGAYSKERVNLFAEQTEKQVTRLTRLIDDMFDIGRMRSGKMTLEYEELDLCQMVAEAIKGMETQLLNCGSGAPTVNCEPIIGNWDRMRLEQVLTNLFTNAIKYGQGKPIEISVQKVDGHGVISVKDNGIGISKENHLRIFDKFERAVSPDEVSGLGLGLFISKQIIEAHGGSIWLESDLGKGSTFFVRLPIVEKVKPKESVLLS